MTCEATAKPFSVESASQLLASCRLLLLPILSSLLLAIAFTHEFRLVAWVALVPLGLALKDERNWLELYLGLYLAGLAFQLIHLDWIRSGSSHAWLTGPRAVQWLVQGNLLALLWPLLLGFGRVFMRRSRLPVALSLPVVWVAFEFSRRHLWTLVDCTGYPYGQLGLSQAGFSRVIQIADLGGVYAVSAILAATSGLIVDVMLCNTATSKRACVKSLVLPVALVVGLIGATLAYGTWRMSQAIAQYGPVVALMPLRSTDAFDKRDDIEMEYLGKFKQASGDARPELLLWHEVACSESIDLEQRDSECIVRMEQAARLAQATLVVGCNRVTDHERFNSAAVVDPRGGLVGCYDKVALVPFREFHPPGRPTFGRTNNTPYTHGSGRPAFEMTLGDPPRTVRFGIGICYDTAFADVIGKQMRDAESGNPPDFFVVPAFEGHDDHMRLQAVLLALAQFRAVETRRAMVRNACGGYSGIIDGNGTLLAQPQEPSYTDPVIVGPVPLDDRVSLYAWIGDVLPMLACVAVVVAVIWPRSKGRPRG